MAEHTFKVNIPNPAKQSKVSNLRLRPVSESSLVRLGLDIPSGKLKVGATQIVIDGKDGEARQGRVRLAPRASTEVLVRITTEPVEPRRGGAAAFHLVDERDEDRIGGVMLLCVEGGIGKASGVVAVKRPCPITMKRHLYTVPPEADPARSGTRSIVASTDVDLVAQITNPTARSVKGVNVYLEHLGGSDGVFTPMTWRAGNLAPGDVFFASWPLRDTGSLRGAFDCSVVVSSEDTNPVRLRAPIRIG